MTDKQTENIQVVKNQIAMITRQLKEINKELESESETMADSPEGDEYAEIVDCIDNAMDSLDEASDYLLSIEGIQ